MGGVESLSRGIEVSTLQNKTFSQFAKFILEIQIPEINHYPRDFNIISNISPF